MCNEERHKNQIECSNLRIHKQFLKYKKIYHQTYLSQGSWQKLENENNGLLHTINKIRVGRIEQIKKYDNT